MKTARYRALDENARFDAVIQSRSRKIGAADIGFFRISNDQFGMHKWRPFFYSIGCGHANGCASDLQPAAESKELTPSIVQ